MTSPARALATARSATPESTTARSATAGSGVAVAVTCGLVGGLATAAAFEPWTLPYLTPVGIGLLVLGARHGSRSEALLTGTLFGVAFMGPVLWWLWASIGPGAWVALTLVQAVWFSVLALGFRWVSHLRSWPLWSALLWTTVELLRSTWPLGGLPWGRLGFGVVDTAWASTLSWVGVTGVSFLVALMGCTLAFMISTPSRRPRTLLALTTPWLLAVIPAAAGAVFPASPFTETAQVGVVQGGVPGAGNRLSAFHRQVTRNHVEETGRLITRTRIGGRAEPDFILWPENATAVDPFRDAEAQTGISTAQAAADVPIVIGSIVDTDRADRALNQGIVWTSDGSADRYTKQHLVPFGEYVPLRSIATRISSRVAEIRRDMVPGADAAPLNVAGLSVADALCFDVAYDDVIGPQVLRGADLVAVQTSNAMFLGTAQLEQQWAISRVRALETGRSVVVASVNGVSGAIGPDGSVLSRLPVQVTGSEVVEVPVSDHRTLAVTLGPWPARSAVALGIAGLLAAGVVRRRTRPSRAEA